MDQKLHSWAEINAGAVKKKGLFRVISKERSKTGGEVYSNQIKKETGETITSAKGLSVSGSVRVSRCLRR